MRENQSGSSTKMSAWCRRVFRVRKEDSAYLYAIFEAHEGVAVPMREVALTNGEVVSLYDCSGPYTDPNVQIDVTKGLPPVREAAVVARGDTELYEGRTIQAVDDGLKEGEKVMVDGFQKLQMLPPGTPVQPVAWSPASNETPGKNANSAPAAAGAPAEIGRAHV